MSTLSIREARSKIAAVGQALFDRHLTDAGGGNISIRAGNRVCISPSLSGQSKRWSIDPADVLVIDLDGKIIEGEGTLSRESNVHLALHNNFADYGNAVIHAHPRNVMVFAAMAMAMPPVLEATQKFGVVQCIEYAPAHSVQLAQHVLNAIKGQEERIRKHAAGVIAPWHGIFLIGKDIDCAFDAVERFDTNAYCILMAQQALGGSDMLKEQRDALQQAQEAFRKQS